MQIQKKGGDILKIALFPNINKNDSKDYTIKLIKKLKRLGAEIVLNGSLKGEVPEGVNMYECSEESARNSDICIAIGGDGTIIRTAKISAKFDKPVLGINLGRLGFVSGIEKEEFGKLERLIEGKYKIEKRAMLNVDVEKSGQKKRFYALNDAVIERGQGQKIADFKIYLNEENICEYRADGLIFATPTGSTAYSLSAGGPVVDSCMNCIILTPICSHSMFSRPAIFGGKSKLSVSVKTREDSNTYLSVDGEESMLLTDKEIIKVTMSKKKVNLIDLHEGSFYSRLTNKLLRRRY